MAIKAYTPSQERTKQIIREGRNILLTGKPGTGKTELLRDICEEQTAAGKKVMVTASTGLAASNLDNGRTLHSTLKYYPGGKDFDLNKCTELLKNADVLIVDEVSMLDHSIIDHMAACINHLDRAPQIIMSGDFFQLPPVTKKRDTIQYPFENPNWYRFNLEPCVLEEIVRQTDPEFKAKLELAMVADQKCIVYFNTATQKKIITGAITLCTKNSMADDINKIKLEPLLGTAKSYYALGEVDKADFTKTRVEKCFSVKKQMRVMALRNDPFMRYQNGSLGTVLETKSDLIKVSFDNGNTVDMERFAYMVDATEKGSEPVKVEQFPLRGGYAITIHKSQGQTFDSVNIMAPQCWDPGQLYVALSRARSVKGIHLMTPIDEKSLIAEPKVVEYYNSLMRGYAA